MSPGPRIAAFVVVLALAFGLGAAVGAATGPIGTGDDTPAEHERPDDPGAHP